MKEIDFNKKFIYLTPIDELADIVLTIDEKSIRFCAAATTSLSKHNKIEGICFHIMTNDLTEESETILSELAKRSGTCTYFYHASKGRIGGY